MVQPHIHATKEVYLTVKVDFNALDQTIIGLWYL